MAKNLSKEEWNVPENAKEDRERMYEFSMVEPELGELL